MSTIRRLYLYAVAFISLIVITWGMIGLARSAFAGEQIGDDVATLAGALALIFVGIPVFLLHWWLAQRGAEQDQEERSSYIRAAFLYGVLLTTIIPVVQNLMTLVNRVAFSVFNISNERMMFGPDQTWTDNLIAIVVNSLIAAYISSVLRKDWAAEPVGNAFAEIRRLYRYIWVIYGLAMMIAGLQQILLYVFDSLEDSALASQAIFANGLTLILAGTPIWVFSWRILQKAAADPAERTSLLRGVILFAVSLISLVVTLFSAGFLLDLIIQIILGERLTFANLMGELRDPVSILIPFGMTWAYFSSIRRKDLTAVDPVPAQLNDLKRVYEHLNAFFGLAAFFIGLQKLCYFIINLLVERPIWVDTYREQLSMAITILVIGLPFWWLNWRQADNRSADEPSVHQQASQSLIRKIYLYLILFISVMGVMISAGMLIFQLLQAVLGDPDEALLQIALELVSLLLLFLLVLWYHGQVLRSDGILSDQIQAEQQADFPILVLVPEFGIFSETIVAALAKEAPDMPVAVHAAGQGIPDETLSDARAVILPASIAASPGEAIRLWLQNFPGVRFVIPTPVEGWLWVSGNGHSLPNMARQTAEMVRKLAEGHETIKLRSGAGWMVPAAIVGGIFGLAFLLLSISILIDVLSL